MIRSFALCCLLVASSCTWVYDITSTRPLDAAIAADAQFFDAPPDAQPMCPPPGVEPKFRGGYIQVPVGYCFSYVPSRDWGKAVAQCFTPTSGIAQGPINTAMSLSTLTPAAPGYYAPRLGSDGMIMFLTNASDTMVEVFARNPDESWSFTGQRPPGTGDRSFSNPTRGPNRRAVYAAYNNSALQYEITEIMEDASGVWTIVDTMPTTEIGVTYIYSLALTSDGLHLTMHGQNGSTVGVFYAQRPDVSTRFGTSIRLTTVPEQGANTPFLTDDCSGIYFSALQTVFYQKLE